MTFRRSFGVLGFLAAFALVGFCRAADDASDPLAAKNLTKNGSTYVLPAEKDLADAMKDLRKLKAKIDAQAKKRAPLEARIKQIKNIIASLDYKRRNLYEQYLKTTDPTQKNNLVAQIKVLESQMTEGNTALQDVQSQLNAQNEGEDKTQFVNTVIDLGQKVDKAQDDYKELASDADVKAALDKTEPGKPKMRLGPTPEFVNNANALKRWRGEVASDTIPLKHENQVPNVEVTLNGTVVRDMVLDSGASMVCLTADLAEQLQIVPTEKDETIQFKMADGKVVDAKKMVLKSVRVGQFTVTDVDCAVLPKNLVAAEPLLGGTFLNNFIFRIDPKAGELHLAVIAGNSKVTTAAPSKDKDKKMAAEAK